MRLRRLPEIVGAICALAASAVAQPAPEAEPEPAPAAVETPVLAPEIQIHGFASQGGFISTANDYIGASERGTLELFEAGVNVSTQPTDRLRVGVQLFSRTMGNFRDASPRLDWAYGDYRWKPWLGLRAGVIKMPFGLHSEYVDIDHARLPILLPQSVYPVRNRDAFLAHTGFTLYGSRMLGSAGELDYQAWAGTLDIPANALELVGAELVRVDTRYVAGAQVFWSPPIEGLRVGATALQASIDFRLQLDPAVVEQLVMAGLLRPGHDGRLRVSQRPDRLGVASVEYVRGDWQLAGEYSRWWKRQETSLPELIPTFEEDSERFYVMANRRLSARVETGAYLSISHADVGDRDGDGGGFAEPFHAFQRDLAATVRVDINDHWLWKFEAHAIDGVAELRLSENLSPERRWGLFLFKTTVSF